MLKIKEKKGFTLIELVIAIAILAVLLAVFAPLLFSHIEESRMQSDESEMSEVVNAVHLAITDSNVFDEAYNYCIPNNYITYTDSSGVYGQRIIDAEYWAPDGSGEGVTITFNPDEKGIYELSKGIVNDIAYGNGTHSGLQITDSSKQCLFEDMGNQLLYSAVKQAVGTRLVNSSASYRNSSYTVFIRFTIADGTKKAIIDGAFNGTNLSEDSNVVMGSSRPANDPQQPPVTPSEPEQPEYSESDLSGGGSLGSSSENAEELTFTVVYSGEKELTYRYKKGMTWRQWIESKYNVDNYFLDANTVVLAERMSNTEMDSIIEMKTSFDLNTGSVSINTEKVLDYFVIDGASSYHIAHVTLPEYWYLSEANEYTAATLRYTATGETAHKESEAKLADLADSTKIWGCPHGLYYSKATYEAAHVQYIEKNYVLPIRIYWGLSDRAHLSLNITTTTTQLTWREIASIEDSDSFRNPISIVTINGNEYVASRDSTSSSGILYYRGKTPYFVDNPNLLSDSDTSKLLRPDESVTVNNSTFYCYSYTNVLSTYWHLSGGYYHNVSDESALAAAPDDSIKLHCPHGTFTSKAAYSAAHQSAGHSGGSN